MFRPKHNYNGTDLSTALSSIGSLGAQGRTDMVEEVHVRDCSFVGTMNGVKDQNLVGDITWD